MGAKTLKNKLIRPVLFGLVVILSAMLFGCDDNKNKGAALKVAVPVKRSEKEVILSGLVANDKGKVIKARIEAVDNSGGVVATSSLSNSDRYSIKIPAGVVFPVELKAYPESGQAVSEVLISVVLDPMVKTYNIDDSTTAIAKKAKSLGGYTAANMMYAAMSGISIPDANKTTGGFRGDPTKQYGGWH